MRQENGNISSSSGRAPCKLVTGPRTQAHESQQQRSVCTGNPCRTGSWYAAYVGTAVSTVRQHIRQWASGGQKERTVCGDAEKGVTKLSSRRGGTGRRMRRKMTLSRYVYLSVRLFICQSVGPSVMCGYPIATAPQPRWATHKSGQNGERFTKEWMHRRNFKRSAIAGRRRPILVNI